MPIEELNHWMNNATFAKDIVFFATLARARYTGAKYLAHGRLWRPPNISVSDGTPMPQAQVCDWGLGETDALCCPVNQALAAAWLTPSGELGLVSKTFCYAPPRNQ